MISQFLCTVTCGAALALAAISPAAAQDVPTTQDSSTQRPIRDFAAGQAMAAGVTMGSPLIDYAGFAALTDAVYPYRAGRLITHRRFVDMAAQSGVLMIDARSASAFAQGHIAGAVNLPLPDFTAESLAAVIGPDVDRPILIYCNNNFINNRRPVVIKAVSLALNIQTFINLYGYGYKNIWELGEAVNMDNPAVNWVTAPAAS